MYKDSPISPTGVVSTNQEIGRQGEELACLMLTEHGWTIIERNWRCRQGEIDIIAYKGRHLSIIEVKTRSSYAFGCGAEAVNARKIERLRRLARAWLGQCNKVWSYISIDVIEVQLSETGPAHMRFIRRVGS